MMDKQGEIHIAIIDNSRFTAEMIAVALDNHPNFIVEANGNSSEDILPIIKNCDVVLIRSKTPNPETINEIGMLLKENPTLKIIVIGLVNSAEAAVTFMECGAVGYAYREESFEHIIERIHQVLDDSLEICDKVMYRLIERLQTLRQLTKSLDYITLYKEKYTELTRREKEILQLIANGFTNKDIAYKLTLQLGTVKNHVHNILSKLGVKSRKEAALFIHVNESIVL